MDGNIKDTPPIVFVPAAADRAPLGSPGPPSWSDARSKARAARKIGPAEFDTLAGRGCKPDEAWPALGPGPRATRLGHQTPTGTPKVAATRVGRYLESPKPATSRRTRRSPTAAWVKLPRRKTPARSWPGWTTSDGYRGWDLWLEGNRVAAHIIHKWPDDAIKVVLTRAEVPANGGTTCSSPTTARARRPGSRSTSTASRRRPTSPPTSSRTRSAPRSRSRSASGTPATRLDGAADLRTCGSTAAPWPRPRSTRLAWADRGREPGRRSPAAKRPERRRSSCLRLVAAAVDPSRRRRCAARLAALEAEEAAIKAPGHDRAT